MEKGPLFIDQIGLLWAESQLKAARKVWTDISGHGIHLPNYHEFTLRVGIETLQGEIEEFSRDWARKVFDDLPGVRVGTLIKERLYELTKRQATPIRDSTLLKMKNSFSWIWEKLLNGFIRDERECYVQHLMELVWTHALNQAMQWDQTASIKQAVKLVNDAHGLGKEWEYVTSLSLEDAFRLIDENLADDSEIHNWVLDGLKVYYKRNTQELAICAINNKVYENPFEMLKKQKQLEKDIRNLNLFMQGLFDLLRSEESVKTLGTSPKLNSAPRWGSVDGIWYMLKGTAAEQRLLELATVIQGKMGIDNNPKKVVKSVKGFAVMRVADIEYTVNRRAKSVTSMNLSVIIWEPPEMNLASAIIKSKPNNS
ncbi:MAG: hypothetical protein ACE5OZ_06190 [Candidatus Heimdallarchaeota archaeon]